MNIKGFNQRYAARKRALLQLFKQCSLLSALIISVCASSVAWASPKVVVGCDDKNRQAFFSTPVSFGTGLAYDVNIDITLFKGKIPSLGPGEFSAGPNIKVEGDTSISGHVGFSLLTVPEGFFAVIDGNHWHWEVCSGKLPPYTSDVSPSVESLSDEFSGSVTVGGSVTTPWASVSGGLGQSTVSAFNISVPKNAVIAVDQHLRQEPIRFSFDKTSITWNDILLLESPDGRTVKEALEDKISIAVRELKLYTELSKRPSFGDDPEKIGPFHSYFKNKYDYHYAIVEAQTELIATKNLLYPTNLPSESSKKRSRGGFSTRETARQRYASQVATRRFQQLEDLTIKYYQSVYLVRSALQFYGENTDNSFAYEEIDEKLDLDEIKALLGCLRLSDDVQRSLVRQALTNAPVLRLIDGLLEGDELPTVEQLLECLEGDTHESDTSQGSEASVLTALSPATKTSSNTPHADPSGY